MYTVGKEYGNYMDQNLQAQTKLEIRSPSSIEASVKIT